MTPPNGNGSSIADRARTNSDVDPRQGLFDREIEDGDLIAALEERERIKEQRSVVNAEFKTADEAAKAKLAEYELAVGEVARIGRFRIKRTRTAPKEVSFETSGSDRLSIKLLDE